MLQDEHKEGHIQLSSRLEVGKLITLYQLRNQVVLKHERWFSTSSPETKHPQNLLSVVTIAGVINYIMASFFTFSMVANGVCSL